jgi:hypothetical protein
MTVRVDTLDALLAAGSPSRVAPTIRLMTAAATDRLLNWWQQRSALSMSSDWMHEYKVSRRDD